MITPLMEVDSTKTLLKNDAKSDELHNIFCQTRCKSDAVYFITFFYTFLKATDYVT